MPAHTVKAAVAGEVDARAESMDLTTSTYLTALFLGARRAGLDMKLVNEALGAGLVSKPKRRLRKAPLDWPTMSGEKGHRRHGAWSLTRLGVPGNHQKPGDGWYLEGPGITEPLYVGLDLREATSTADEIVRRHEQQQRGEHG